MGNILCKERINRADNPKSTVDRIVGRCPQICPDAGSKNTPNYWQNHVLETRPPTSNQPKSATLDGDWRSVTLKTATLPATPVTITTPDHPVAPPRRKRNSFLKGGRPGGFKDVFGNFTRRSSCASATSFDKTGDGNAKRRNSSSDIHSDDFCDFSKDIPEKKGLKRKISKVGNKKSDKFFGENLSDCLSDSPILASTPIVTKKEIKASDMHNKDKIDAFIENNVPKIEQTVSAQTHSNEPNTKKIENAHQSNSVPETMSKDIKVQATTVSEHTQSQMDKDLEINASLDKKAEFLMAMLEGYNKDQEMAYQNKTPVEEPLIVPKRKHGRHICDDEEKLKRVFQSMEQEAEEKTFPNTLESGANIEKDIEVVVKHVEKTNAKPILQEPSYDHLQPVNEPIIVPTRKVYKHICHDDDHMHDMIHSEKTDEAKPSSENIHSVIQNTSPRKPERDFSKYNKSANLSEEKIESSPQVDRPIRRKQKSLSRENLPSPPPRPARSEDSLNRSEPKPIKPVHNLKQSSSHTDTTTTIDAPSVPPELLNNEKLDSILKKCNSSQSFLTPDLMDQIVNKVYGFKMSWDDHDSVHHGGYDDCSGQVAPNSKVKSRKISAIRKELIGKRIIEETEEGKKATFSIGDTAVTVGSPTQITELKSERKNKLTDGPKGEKKLKGSRKPGADTKNIRPPLQTGNSTVDDGINLLPDNNSNVTNSKPNSTPFNSIPDSNTQDNTKTISKDNEIETKPALNIKDLGAGNLEKLIETLKPDDITNVLEGIYSNNKTLLGDLHEYLQDSNYNDKLFKAVKDQEEAMINTTTSAIADAVPKIEISKPELNKDNNESEENDDTPMTPPLFFKLRHKHLFNSAGSHITDEDLPIIPDRRGSIVEQDTWFLNHSGTNESDHQETSRRGSECLSYDTRKLFPFGNREKADSESADFFDTKQFLKHSTGMPHSDKRLIRRGSECISYDPHKVFPFSNKRNNRLSEPHEFVESKVLSKSTDHINKIDEEEPKSNNSAKIADQQLEHSTLLKFFDIKKNTEKNTNNDSGI